ncbi:hypothetical protein DDI_1207 [Dickeya dianthicola RNS04.9]|nr:hypothetical protein DDI_1207 [Dickeya dianthicola RNS04.9]
MDKDLSSCRFIYPCNFIFIKQLYFYCSKEVGDFCVNNKFFLYHCLSQQ